MSPSAFSFTISVTQSPSSTFSVSRYYCLSFSAFKIPNLAVSESPSPTSLYLSLSQFNFLSLSLLVSISQFSSFPISQSLNLQVPPPLSLSLYLPLPLILSFFLSICLYDCHFLSQFNFLSLQVSLSHFLSLPVSQSSSLPLSLFPLYFSRSHSFSLQWISYTLNMPLSLSLPPSPSLFVSVSLPSNFPIPQCPNFPVSQSPSSTSLIYESHFLSLPVS